MLFLASEARWRHFHERKARCSFSGSSSERWGRPSSSSPASSVAESGALMSPRSRSNVSQSNYSKTKSFPLVVDELGTASESDVNYSLSVEVPLYANCSTSLIRSIFAGFSPTITSTCCLSRSMQACSLLRDGSPMIRSKGVPFNNRKSNFTTNPPNDVGI